MIDSYKICKKIHNKLDGEVTLATITETVLIIIKYMKEKMIKNEPIYVQNLGTFFTKIEKSKLIIINKQPFFVEEKRKVWFTPHYLFAQLIKDRSPPEALPK